jgi:hypothetical protein
MTFDGFVDQANHFLARLGGGHTARKVGHIGAMAGVPLFDYDCVAQMSVNINIWT